MTTRGFNLNVRLSEEEYAALKFIAAHQKKPISEIVREKLFAIPNSTRNHDNCIPRSVTELIKICPGFRRMRSKWQKVFELVQCLHTQTEPVRNVTLKNLYPLLEDIQQFLELSHDWQGESQRQLPPHR